MHPVRASGSASSSSRIASNALLLIALLLLPASPVRADDGDKHVIVTISGSEDERAALRTVLTELLDRLQVTQSFRDAERVEVRAVLDPPPNPEPAVARVWVDLTSDMRATIYLVDRRWERILVRHVAAASRGDEVAREETAHIIEASVDALLHGAVIGVTRAEATAALVPEVPEVPEAREVPVPKKRPTPKTRKARARPPRPPSLAATLDMAAGYDVTAWDFDHDPVHGPMVSFGARFLERVVHPAMRIEAHLRFPTALDAGPVVLSVQSAGLRGQGGFEAPITDPVAVRVLLGGGFDTLDVTTTLAPGTTGVVDDRTVTFEARLGAIAGALLRFDALIVFLDVTADVAIQKQRYFVDHPDGRTETVLEPWWVRPGLRLGVGADLVTFTGGP